MIHLHCTHALTHLVEEEGGEGVEEEGDLEGTHIYSWCISTGSLPVHVHVHVYSKMTSKCTCTCSYTCTCTCAFEFLYVLTYSLIVCSP